MKTLPVTPVDALANALRTAAPAPAPAPARNPGIVPPWLQHPDRNPGIVPPWLRDDVVAPTHPVPDDRPRILAAAGATVYDPTPAPVELEPDTPRIWLG